jgi:hypothetical protein
MYIERFLASIATPAFIKRKKSINRQAVTKHVPACDYTGFRKDYTDIADEVFNLCNLNFNRCNQGRHFCDALY